MARRITHMGPIGAGQTTKLCNQVIVGCAMAVLAEATRLASNAGIDAGKLPEALAGGFADSIPLQLFVPRMMQGIHSPPLGHIATMLKDLDTVADVAQATSTPVPMATLAGQIFRLGKAALGARMSTRWKSTSFPLQKRLTLDGAGIAHLLKSGISPGRLIRTGLRSLRLWNGTEVAFVRMQSRGRCGVCGLRRGRRCTRDSDCGRPKEG
jgi:hypothetical protein